MLRAPVTMPDGTKVFLADVYLDLRGRRPGLRQAEVEGRVRVQREQGDLGELLVVVEPLRRPPRILTTRRAAAA